MFGSTRDTFIKLLTTQKPMEIWWNNRGRVAAVVDVDHSDVRINLSKDMLSGLHGDKSLRFCFQTDSTVGGGSNEGAGRTFTRWPQYLR